MAVCFSPGGLESSQPFFMAWDFSWLSCLHVCPFFQLWIKRLQFLHQSSLSRATVEEMDLHVGVWLTIKDIFLLTNLELHTFVPPGKLATVSYKQYLNISFALSLASVQDINQHIVTFSFWNWLNGCKKIIWKKWFEECNNISCCFELALTYGGELGTSEMHSSGLINFQEELVSVSKYI